MMKIGSAKRSRSSSNAVDFGEGLLAILLDAGSAQSGKAMLIDGKLPREEFVDGQRVAAAGLLEGEQTAAYCGDDFGLTANYPPFGPGRGQIRDC
jgi:dihydroxyacetone kinase DhaKLM complex PTS-EIIA-like component DhaM